MAQVVRSGFKIAARDEAAVSVVRLELTVPDDAAQDVAERLARGYRAVIGDQEHAHVVVDVRTVSEEDERNAGRWSEAFFDYAKRHGILDRHADDPPIAFRVGAAAAIAWMVKSPEARPFVRMLERAAPGSGGSEEGGES